jgi:hypothetical protein
VLNVRTCPPFLIRRRKQPFTSRPLSDLAASRVGPLRVELRQRKLDRRMTGFAQNDRLGQHLLVRQGRENLLRRHSGQRRSFALANQTARTTSKE